MRDGEIRAVLHERIRSEHPDPGTTRIVDELSVCGSVRVDVSVINGALTGYELKSAHDDLRRLPKQVEIYSRVLDYAYLVVAADHVPDAMNLVPDWWGVMVADGSDGVTVSEHRAGTMNPSVDGQSLATLLWRDEVVELLEERGLMRGLRSKPRSVLWAALAEHLSVDEVRRAVREALRHREGWRDPQ